MWIDDDILQRRAEPIASSVFCPQEVTVVLGSSNVMEQECRIQQCAADHVPILRRYGGGGAVVLYPGCIVVSLGLWVREAFENSFYFKEINQAIIESCVSLSDVFKDLSQNGISDIVFHEKKVAGTSLFRSRNYLLYQGSLLAELDLNLIDRYLQHPTREPEYRRKRSHNEFLTGLSNISGFNAGTICAHLREKIPQAVSSRLSQHLIAPLETQFKNLDQRRESALTR